MDDEYGYDYSLDQMADDRNVGREEVQDQISECLTHWERGDLDIDEFIGAMRSLAVGVDPRQAAGWPLDNR